MFKQRYKYMYLPNVRIGYINESIGIKGHRDTVEHSNKIYLF